MKTDNPDSQMTPEPCVCQIEHWSILVCEGEDARTFLQGQVTTDLNTLTLGQGALGACLNLQGRAISSFFLIARAEHCFWLVLPRDILEKTQASLGKYAVFSKVTLQPMTDTCTLYGLAGYTMAQLKDILPGNAVIPEKRYETGTWGQQVLLKLNGPHRYLLVAPQDALDPPKSTHQHAWLMHQLLAVEPLIGLELSEKIIPSNLNYAELGAISYEKGCYRGQEIIARLHYRGTSKEGLYLIQALLATGEDESASNDSFTGKTLCDATTQQAIGTLITSAWGKDNTLVILAVCKKALFESLLQNQGQLTIEACQLSQLQRLELHYTD